LQHASLQQDAGSGTPADGALPHLARALDPCTAGVRLEALVGNRGGLTARVLKHTPGKRCVILYEYADGTRVVAKLYRKDRAAQHAATLAALGSALAGDVRTPRLLALWEDLGAVVQEWVPGDAVPDYAHLGAEGDLLERLGAALADLHAAPVAIGAETDLERHMQRTCHPGPQALAAELPEMARAAAILAAELLAADQRLARTLRPCHGDFSPRQVFVHGPRVWLVDLDGFCRAAPALDVANFRVGLEAHLGEAGAVLGDRFLAAYRARSGGPAHLPGLGVYEALGWLRRAVILWRKRPPGWQQDIALVLERGRAKLTGAADGAGED
jgi:aminoglycoside phosphotransferase (APT) family kinase protein